MNAWIAFALYGLGFATAIGCCAACAAGGRRARRHARPAGLWTFRWTDASRTASYGVAFDGRHKLFYSVIADPEGRWYADASYDGENWHSLGKPSVLREELKAACERDSTDKFRQEGERHD